MSSSSRRLMTSSMLLKPPGARCSAVVQHMKDLQSAGADGFIVFPLPCEGTAAEQTLVSLGKDVWPRVNS